MAARGALAACFDRCWRGGFLGALRPARSCLLLAHVHFPGTRMDGDGELQMTAGRAALVELMHRCLGGLLDPSVTLLEVRKLMYSLLDAGEPLKLRYKAAPYGPYSENLRHVLPAIDGHLIAGYDDGGDAPDKSLTLVPGAVEEAAAFIAEHRETRERFDRVAALVEGFESPLGLELLSTVQWVMRNEPVRTRRTWLRARKPGTTASGSPERRQRKRTSCGAWARVMEDGLAAHSRSG